jgi:hypothetical protein
MKSYEELTCEQLEMSIEFQKTYNELELCERKQDTVRRGLEILTRLASLETTPPNEIKHLIDSKLKEFLTELKPHK